MLGVFFAHHKLSFACNFCVSSSLWFSIFWSSLQFYSFGLFARPSFSSNLAIVLQVFCLFYFFFQFSVLLSLSFVVILFSLCIYLIFVLQYRFSLFQIACHRFVSVVERLDSAKAASLLPFFYLLPILPGFCITISICDSLLQTKLFWYLLLSALLHVLEGILRLKDCYPVFPRFSKKL